MTNALSPEFYDSIKLMSYLLVPDQPEFGIQLYDTNGQITYDEKKLKEKRKVTLWAGSKFSRPTVDNLIRHRSVF